MNKINYQKELDKELEKITQSGKKPTLLLHACCAPCSSYVLEYLTNYFEITIFYYNPNIATNIEYNLRESELKRFIKEAGYFNFVSIEDDGYTPNDFYGAVKGFENCIEGQKRCEICYELRLRHTAERAKKEDFDYFATTLSISPLKDAEKLNSIGKDLSIEYGVPYLFSDFKKKNGYKRSIELSHQYNLYRQDYCGCIYSKKSRDIRISNTNLDEHP